MVDWSKATDLFGESQESRAREEGSILEFTKDFLLKSGVVGHPPERIKWLGPYSDPDKPVLLRGRSLGLRRSLQGKLSSDEWKPLLASSLLLYSKFRKVRIMIDGGAFVFCLAAFGLFEFFVFFPNISFLPSGFSRGYLGGGIVALPLFGFLLLFLRVTGPLRRSLRYRADEMVFRDLGMGPGLLQVLRKIEEMPIDRGTNRNPLGLPTIKQRIAKLSAILNNESETK